MPGRDLARGRGRARLLATVGPAFVAAIAYVDPGNFATNFTGGVRYGYQLLWAIVLASIAASAVQYATSKVGLATGQSLPQLCRARFSGRVNWTLWVQGEVVAMATDLAEFVGAAVGLHLVFGLPLLVAGVLTAACVFLLLALERYRRGAFVAAIAAGLASSAVGTYAGQVVMSGFVHRRIPIVARRAITMIPSLIVLALAVNPTQVLVLSQVVLSFCIPFALIPLLLVSRDRPVMAELANRHATTTMLALISAVIIALNAWLLYAALR